MTSCVPREAGQVQNSKTRRFWIQGWPHYGPGLHICIECMISLDPIRSTQTRQWNWNKCLIRETIYIMTISYEHSVWASSPCMDRIRDTAVTPRKPKMLVTHHVHVASRNNIHDHWKQDEVTVEMMVWLGWPRVLPLPRKIYSHSNLAFGTCGYSFIQRATGS